MEQDILDHFREEDYYKGRIIAIKYFYFESQALFYAARLREQGIKTFISNANTITAFPLGDGGIGLHIREIDQEQALNIISVLDSNDQNGAQNHSFHDADLEDIAYEKALSEGKHIKEPVLLLFLFILSLIIFRAFMRAKGFLFWGDSF